MALRALFGITAGFIGGGIVSNRNAESSDAGISLPFVGKVSCLNNTIVQSRQSPLGEHSRRDDRVFSNIYKEYVLAEVIPMAHDTALFRFLLPDANDVFNLKPCSTLQAQFELGSNRIEQIQRYYTPVTPNGTKGYFDIICKRKPGGKMTEHIFGLQIGDKLRFKSQTFKIRYEANRWDEVGMIAGGTGFTPMLQVIRHALDEGIVDRRGKPDMTKLSLLYCTRTEKHQLLKGLFEDYKRRFPDRFRVQYCIDNWSEEAEPEEKAAYKGYVGYANRQMIVESLPRPNGNKHQMLVCGPDGLLHHVCGTSYGIMDQLSSGKNNQPVSMDQNNLTPLGGVLETLGWQGHQVYRF